MKKNLILMLLLLTGAVSMTGQELLYDGPEMVVQGNVVNKGKIKSMIPIELRGENAKIDNLEGEGSEIFAAGMIVGEGTLVDNKGTLIIGETPRELVIGSNHYSIGDFGAAGIWMTENLREIPTGGTIGAGTSTTTKYYNYPDNKEENVASYGYLYSWAAATNGSSATTDQGATDHAAVQGICPTSWHLPSDYEWTELETVIGTDVDQTYSTTAGASTAFATTNETTGYRGGNLDRKMKTASLPAADGVTTGAAWDSGTSKSKSANGFNALPAGTWSDSATNGFGAGAAFWSSSSSSSSHAWRRYMTTDNDGSNRNSYRRWGQYSVRCKKD